MDNFGVQYTVSEHSHHLILALQEDYAVTTDWEGKKFSGINLAWDYHKQTCRLTMNGYINELRLVLGHKDPIKPQHSPHKHRPITTAPKHNYPTIDEDTSPPLDAAGIKQIQKIVGSLLYYSGAVDNKLLCTLSAIGMNQAAATQSQSATNY